MTILMAAAVAMAVCMLIFVHFFSEKAIEYDIKKDLTQRMDDMIGNFTVEDGQVILSEGEEEEPIQILIIEKNGEVLAGTYPEGLWMENVYNRKYGVSKIKSDGEVYYTLDREKWKVGKDCFVRGIIKKSDVSSRYISIKYIAYVSTAAIFVLVMLAGWILSRQMVKSLKCIWQTAEQIGVNNNLCQRVEYEGPFREMIIMAQADNRMLDRMEEMFRQQEQFTSDVAHELRTPISVIMAQCQHAGKHQDSVEEMAESLNVIGRQSQKINDLIFTLLELSRLEQGRMQIEQEQIDLVEIVEAICEDEQEKAGEDLDIQMELAKAETEGDINLVAIAIHNLLTNAIKFSPKPAHIIIRTGEKEGQIFVSVQDFGKGISREEQERIFKRFYKEDKSRNSCGYGLGLALTMKIAQKHGGTVNVDSREGEGSTFTMFLKKENA